MMATRGRFVDAPFICLVLLWLNLHRQGDAFGVLHSIHSAGYLEKVKSDRSRVGDAASARCNMAAKGFGARSSRSGTGAKSSSSRKTEGKKQHTKGFGGGETVLTPGGKGSRTSSNANRPAETASATVQKDVVQRTEEEIRRSMDALKNTRPQVWEALELRKRLAMWQSQTAALNVVQLANLPPRQVQETKALEAQLKDLQLEHGISDRLLHNIAQEATWDASARVKDQRQANVQLPSAAVEHMQAVVSRADTGPDSRVMDVGTGTGILLRFLQGSGVRQEQFVGVDLSKIMVEVARERYPDASFIQGDFLDYAASGQEGGFTHVFFNGCLHNFLEPGEALAKAASILAEGGKIVISHPKGASNVEMQRRANPMLVPNRLPTEQDLAKACEAIPALVEAGMRVVPDTRKGVSAGGYLQVLQNVR